MSYVDYDVSPQKELYRMTLAQTVTCLWILVPNKIYLRAGRNWWEFMLSSALCNNEMGLGDEYNDRSQQLACLRQIIHTHKQ